MNSKFNTQGSFSNRTWSCARCLRSSCLDVDTVL